MDPRRQDHWWARAARDLPSSGRALCFHLEHSLGQAVAYGINVPVQVASK